MTEDEAQADGNATGRFVAFVGQVNSWLNIDDKSDAMAMEGEEETRFRQRGSRNSDML
jgi:hypothetical protein